MRAAGAKQRPSPAGTQEGMREEPARHRPQGTPGETHSRRSCAGLTAPDHPGTSQSAWRAAKRLYAPLRANQGYPGRDRKVSGRNRRGATGWGWTPGKTPPASPRADLAAPQTSQTSESAWREAKLPYTALRAKQEHPGSRRSWPSQGARQPGPEHRPASRAGPG